MGQPSPMLAPVRSLTWNPWMRGPAQHPQGPGTYGGVLSFTQEGYSRTQMGWNTGGRPGEEAWRMYCVCLFLFLQILGTFLGSRLLCTSVQVWAEAGVGTNPGGAGLCPSG